MHEIRRYRKTHPTTIYATDDPNKAYIISTETDDSALVINENIIDCIDLLEISRDMINKNVASQTKYRSEKLYALSRIEFALRTLSTLK